MAPPGGADYFAVGGGGKLKLKGGIKDGRVDKKKKKRKDKEKEQEEENRVDLSKENESEPKEDGNQDKAPEDEDDLHPKIVYKTEAERNHEEKRRKRV